MRIAGLRMSAPDQARRPEPWQRPLSSFSILAARRRIWRTPSFRASPSARARHWSTGLCCSAASSRPPATPRPPRCRPRAPIWAATSPAVPLNSASTMLPIHIFRSIPWRSCAAPSQPNTKASSSPTSMPCTAPCGPRSAICRSSRRLLLC